MIAIQSDDIRAFRNRYGLPQGALATLLGCSKRTIEEWEGARNPTPAMLGLALAALAADLRPWQNSALQITSDGDGYRVRYEDGTAPGFAGECVAARAFVSREAAEAFVRFWEGADTSWDGVPVARMRREVSRPSIARRPVG
ncbi:helix-turn-helix domain-containing protein [Caulobacter ginsengisoli]|uniref:helix-turn-helix domain-containing protein n=1 Tax=Caulobacter ginsengisoli TaxID=400775 RepID=UPI003521C977